MTYDTYKKLDRFICRLVAWMPLPIMGLGMFLRVPFWVEMLIIFLSIIPYLFYGRVGRSILYKQIDGDK